MHLRFRLYEKGKPVPFSQGFAIREIHKTIGGKLEGAGEVDSQHDFEGTLLYVKTSYTDIISESIWHDNGTGVNCVYHRTNDEQWKQKIDTKWEPIELTIEWKETNEHNNPVPTN